MSIVSVFAYSTWCVSFCSCYLNINETMTTYKYSMCSNTIYFYPLYIFIADFLGNRIVPQGCSSSYQCRFVCQPCRFRSSDQSHETSKCYYPPPKSQSDRTNALHRSVVYALDVCLFIYKEGLRPPSIHSCLWYYLATLALIPCPLHSSDDEDVFHAENLDFGVKKTFKK